MIIQKLNVTSQIVEYMKKQIEDGEWKVGGMIPSETVLTKVLGVSRASVRAAIQQFIALGLMESYHGKGTFLISDDMRVFRTTGGHRRQFSKEDIVQSLQYRIFVEKGTVQLAAERITSQSLERLESYLEAMKQCVGSTEEFVRNDMMFHREISDACGNLFLKHGLGEVLSTTIEYHNQLNELVGYRNGIYYHTMILKALKNQDGKKAGQLMEEHLQTSLRDALEGLEEKEV